MESESDSVPPIPAKSALYVWGSDESGQTAHGSTLQVRRCLRVPKRVAANLFSTPRGARTVRLLDIACGLQHTAAVASDGSLFTWGSNEYGQLGDGTENDCREPKRVKSLCNEFVRSVACGANCTAAIAEPRETFKDGGSSSSRLWVWGQHQGSNYPRIFWGAFPPNTEIKQVACGASHVAALAEFGTLQMWGYNEYGQLGRGFSCEGRQEACIVNAFVRFLDEPPENVQIIQVACGDYHTAAISDIGDVYTWGLGYMGQLGHRSLQSPNKEVLPRRVVGLEAVNIKEIACGGIHTCAVSAFGALYMWGGGQVGQLGLGPQKDVLSCHANDLSMFLRHIPVLVIPSGVQLVTCGQCHTLVVMKDGRLLGWGYNSCGQAATGKSPYAWHPSPIDWCVGDVRRLAAGGGHSAVLTQACSLKGLCEFKLADTLNLVNAPAIEEIAVRNGSDALARFCVRFRELILIGGDDYHVENGDKGPAYEKHVKR
eukprot:c25173_g1_i1 orf=392-1846(-)